VEDRTGRKITHTKWFPGNEDEDQSEKGEPYTIGERKENILGSQRCLSQALKLGEKNHRGTKTTSS